MVEISPKIKKDATFWIDEFRNGNDGALSYIFDLHYRALCYFCRRLIQQKAEAEDIVSECFVKLWQRRDNFESTQGIKAFLYISCRNACLDFLKQLQKRTTIQEDYFRQLEVIDLGILNQVVESEFLNSLHHELAALPEQCRKIFSMIYFEGKKTDEIADLLGLSVKTVRNHKARAVRLLHSSFLKKGVSEVFMLFFYIFLQKK